MTGTIIVGNPVRRHSDATECHDARPLASRARFFVPRPTSGGDRVTVVQGAMTAPAGASLGRGQVTIRLVTPSQAAPGYTSSGEIVGTLTIEPNSTGSWSVDLVPNASITPAGTVYEVVESWPATGGRASSRITVPASGGPYQLAAVLA